MGIVFNSDIYNDVTKYFGGFLEMTQTRQKRQTSTGKKKTNGGHRPKEKSDFNTMTLDHIIEIFGRQTSQSPPLDQHYHKLCLERAKTIVGNIIDDDAFRVFINDLDTGFLDGKNKCQMTIWHAISPEICRLLESLVTHRKVDIFDEIKDKLKGVSDKDIQKKLFEYCVTPKVGSKKKKRKEV